MAGHTVAREKLQKSAENRKIFSGAGGKSCRRGARLEKNLPKPAPV